MSPLAKFLLERMDERGTISGLDIQAAAEKFRQEGVSFPHRCVQVSYFAQQIRLGVRNRQ